MTTLYVSDLDGTLLQPDARLSDTTVEILNREIAAGKLFTVATARTPATVAPILERVDMRLPAIVMTGAALWDTRTRRYSRVVYMDPQAAGELVEVYRATQTPTFLYTLVDDMIHIYHIGPLSELERDFINERVGNRFKVLHIPEDGNSILPARLDHVVLFYGMQPDRKAREAYERIREVRGIRPQFYHDIFGEEIGIIEAFSDKATKAEAMRAVAARYGADRTVAFGDNVNDLPMMIAADHAVAVANALQEVKEAADEVIGTNVSDAVANYIAGCGVPQEEASR